MTLQVLHFPLTDINLRTQLPPPFSSPALLCLLTVPLLEIHFSRFLCRCSQFSRSTHTHALNCVCESLVSVSFFPIFFFIFWFSGFTPNSVQLVTCHATSSCNVVGGCSRPSIIDYGPLYGPRAVLSLIRFLLFPHTCLWPGPGRASMELEMEMEMGMWKVHFHWNSSSSSNRNNQGNFMVDSLK